LASCSAHRQSRVVPLEPPLVRSPSLFSWPPVRVRLPLKMRRSGGRSRRGTWSRVAPLVVRAASPRAPPFAEATSSELPPIVHHCCSAVLAAAPPLRRAAAAPNTSSCYSLVSRCHCFPVPHRHSSPVPEAAAPPCRHCFPVPRRDTAPSLRMPLWPRVGHPATCGSPRAAQPF